MKPATSLALLLAVLACLLIAVWTTGWPTSAHWALTGVLVLFAAAYAGGNNINLRK